MGVNARLDDDKAKLLTNEHNGSHYGTVVDVHYDRKKKPQSTRKSYGFLQVFRYVDCKDILLIITGVVCAAVQGSSFPILSIIFGEMTDSFILQATKGFAQESVDKNDIQYNNTQSGSATMIDEGLEPALTRQEFDEKMLLYSRCYLFVAFTVFISAFLQTMCWETVAERQLLRLRKMFFSQMLRQDISWYDQNESGDLTVKLSDDLERIREGTGCKFGMVIQYMSTFVAGLTVGFYSNWRLTAVICAMGPLLIGTSAYLAKVASSSAAREQLKYALAGGIAEEVLVNVKTVAAFCRESKEIDRYRMALNEGRKLAMQKYLVLSIGIAVVFFVMYASYGFAFWYGSSLVVNHLCTAGSIFTVFFSVMAGAFSVGNALPFINSVSTASGAASTIFDIIEREPEIDPLSNKGLIPQNEIKGNIHFTAVSFKYPARPDVKVLHDLNIDIQQGKTVAFVGSSGAGKSTIVGLFLRFYDPTEGQITLDGISLKDLNLKWLRKQIGVVAQEPVLFTASIAENIRYGKHDISDKEMMVAAKMANAHYFISKLPDGYNTVVGDRGSQLSGGQKQRIAIARALVRNPKILLLDEATSALDAHSEGFVQEALDKAMAGRTTIIIAHRLSTVKNADIIYVMKNGCVAEYGKHQELMDRNGLYHNLVIAQTMDKCDLMEKLPTREERVEVEMKLKSEYLRRYSTTSSVESYCADDINDYSFTHKEGLPEVSMWQLIKLNSEEWLCLTIGIIACAITGAVIPAFSIFYTEMFVTFTLDYKNMLFYAKFWSFMFVALAVVSGSALFVQTLCLTSAAEKLIMRVRARAFENILRQPVGWFDLESFSAGYLITRLARDAPLVKAAAGLRVGHVISACITMISGFLIALIFGWKLALLLAIAVPFIVGAAYQQNMILRKTQMRDSRLMDMAGRIASECVQNVRTVQALGNEELFINQYIDRLKEPYKESQKHALSYSLVFSLSQAVIYMMYAGAFRYGAHLIQIGEMTPSDTYRAFFALAFCAASVGNTFSFLQDYAKARHASRLIMQLINMKSEIDPVSPSGAKPVISGKICFKDVHFKYPSRLESNVLRGISFTLNPGKTLALVGESGCGKSTVIALLERFYDPCSGIVEVDDYDVKTLNLLHLRSHIGIVTQEPNLFDCSIKDNITYGLVKTIEDPQLLMQKVIECAKNANIHNFISTLKQGYDTMVGERGTQLSGGQKQRIAIARALIRDPKILLLDEATSALDTESEKIVQDALDKARKGRTCIIVAHRLCTIQNADVIAVMHKGRIIEHGTHDQLLQKKGYYFRLTERQL